MEDLKKHLLHDFISFHFNKSLAVLIIIIITCFSIIRIILIIILIIKIINLCYKDNSGTVAQKI